MSTALDLIDLKVQKARLDAMAAMLGYGTPPANPHVAWEALVASKEAAGLSKVEAIIEAAKERPALYAQQRIPKAQFRASR
jgi:hypothetical protein